METMKAVVKYENVADTTALRNVPIPPIGRGLEPVAIE